MAIQSSGLPAGFPTLPSTVYTQVLAEADQRGIQDGKVSDQELQLLAQHYASTTFIQFDQNFANKQQALDVMRSNFGVFSNNRGLHPSQPRTMEFRIGEDDHIRPNEIYGVGSRDGNSLHVSQYDVTGQGFPPTQPPFPGFPGGGSFNYFFQIYQQFLQIFQRLFGGFGF